MLIFSFFQWWYSQGWANSLKSIGASLANVANSFSLPLLAKTLFAPWKQIVSKPRSDAPLGFKMRAVLDNLVSRFVGFWVRLFVIIAGLLSLAAVFVFRFIVFATWPLLPISPLIVLIVSML